MTHLCGKYDIKKHQMSYNTPYNVDFYRREGLPEAITLSQKTAWNTRILYCQFESGGTKRDKGSNFGVEKT